MAIFTAMRIKFGQILLTCLLLAVANVYGNTGKPGAVTLSAAHTDKGSDYSHSSLNCNNELELSVTHSLSGSSQQAGVKKLSAFGNVESVQAFASRQTNLFSFPTATSVNRSVHLLLIFPFHYFW